MALDYQNTMPLKSLWNAQVARFSKVITHLTMQVGASWCSQKHLSRVIHLTTIQTNWRQWELGAYLGDYQYVRGINNFENLAQGELLAWRQWTHHIIRSLIDLQNAHSWHSCLVIHRNRATGNTTSPGTVIKTQPDKWAWCSWCQENRCRPQSAGFFLTVSGSAWQSASPSASRGPALDHQPYFLSCCVVSLATQVMTVGSLSDQWALKTLCTMCFQNHCRPVSLGDTRSWCHPR